MIKDLEVKQWDYTVYFETEEGTTRLVFTFDSSAEAERCVEMIESIGLKAWYKSNVVLTKIV